MGKFKNKVALITGASRGIGEQISKDLAKEGAKVILAAKTKDPHAILSGTIESVATDIKSLGGSAYPYKLDVRDEEGALHLFNFVQQEFGVLDILINNAGAIYLTDTETTSMKQYDLMQSINTRAVFMMSKTFLPLLKKSSNAHILNLSPPLNMKQDYLSSHVAYTISKFGMSLCTLGMSKEFADDKIAVNSLWPKTLIYTAAVERLLGKDSQKSCRTANIVADAALYIFAQNASEFTGNLFLDEEVLQRAGIKDFDKYLCVKDGKPLTDLYVS